MQIIRLNTVDINPTLPPIAMTIGNFDGVHLGHQALITQLKMIAAQQQLKTAVLLFEPQPLEFFLGQDAPPRITSLREKIDYLQALKLDYLILVQFDDVFRQQTALEFAQVMQKKLNVQHLVLGDDFHFGKNRQGNKQFLREYGFEVTDIETVKNLNQRVSSTLIRQVLQSGDFLLAQQLLGRPYTIVGRVVKGDQIGRTLDFPTLNIALNRPKPCLHGIYAVDVLDLSANLLQTVAEQNPNQRGIIGYQPQSLFGAAHVGTRPAIQQNQLEWRLEVHLPDVDANLYGRLMQITFLHYLHGEKNYPSLEALKQGIWQDVSDLCAWREQHLISPLKH